MIKNQKFIKKTSNNPSKFNNLTSKASINYPNGQISNFNYLPNFNDEKLANINNQAGSISSTPNQLLSNYSYTYNSGSEIVNSQEQNYNNKINSYKYDSYGQLTVNEITNIGGNVANGNNVTLQGNANTVIPSGINTVANSINIYAPLINDTETTYSTSTSTGATEILTLSPNNAGNVNLAITGYPTNGDTVTLNINTPTQGVIPITTTVTSNSQDLTQIATNIVASINSNSILRSLNITANNSGTSSAPTSNIKYNTNTYLTGNNGSGNDDNRTYTNVPTPLTTPSSSNNYYNSYKLKSPGSFKPSYDNNGNLLNDGINTYEYDAQNRLIQINETNYNYTPYGNVTVNSGSSGQAPSVASDFQYAGYYYHAASGLNLTLNRAYSSNLARWLTRDPIGEAGGINLYGYVMNDPVALGDLLGLYIYATYSQASHTFNAYDTDNPGITFTSNNIFSGNSFFQDNSFFQAFGGRGPIPQGDYFIEPRIPIPGEANYEYPLNEMGSGIQNFFGIPNSRGGFTIHPGLRSNGCVTFKSIVPENASNYPANPEFDQLMKMLENTNSININGVNINGFLRVVP